MPRQLTEQIKLTPEVVIRAWVAVLEADLIERFGPEGEHWQISDGKYPEWRVVISALT